MEKFLNDLQYQLAQCGCLPIGPSPDLNQYFQLVMQQLQAAPESLDARAQAMKDADAKEEIAQRDKALKDRISTIAGDLFTRRDGNRDGVLSKDEANVFFNDYMTEYKKFALELAELISQNAVQPPPLPKIEHLMSNDPEAVEEDKKQDIENVRSVSKECATIKLDRYFENEALMNAAAFAVIDKNKDGELQKQEVVNALVPGTEQNLAFLRALGVLTWQEMTTVQQMQSMTGSGCPIQ